MLPILNSYLKLLINILPIFVFVYFLMLLSNYFTDKELLQKHMGESGTIKGWAIAIIAGIASAGPVYMWYPLME
ncbi:MAG TPA: permease, partial [Trueperaceae bacterium]|nr:permease [Trueperaceae bacterium]